MNEETQKKKILLNAPSLDDADAFAVADLLRSGGIASDGALTKEVQAAISRRFNIPHALLVTSATHALELSIMAMGLGPGDEVILPSFTFASVATAIVRSGATPIFADIDEPSLTLNIADVEKRITAKTRAIVLAHYAGIGMDNSALLELARANGLYVIEDAAQCIGARYKGTWLGGFGDAGCYSFHYTKNITCGEGGAFLTSNPDLARRAEICREKGTDRSRFLRGEVDKYRWVGDGSSFVISEIQAALLKSQLLKLDAITQRRVELFNHYNRRLSGIAKVVEISLPFVPEGSEPNGHLYYVLMKSGAVRDAVMDFLKGEGIGATFHYVPLHSSPYAREKWGLKPEDLPVTESICARLLRLPLHPGMTEADIDRVADTLMRGIRKCGN